MYLMIFFIYIKNDKSYYCPTYEYSDTLINEGKVDALHLLPFL